MHPPSMAGSNPNCVRPRSANDRVPAVFLDRDGVLIVDNGPLMRGADIELMPGAAAALQQLRRWGFLLIGVSNQAVVARGLCSPRQVRELQAEVEARLTASGAPPLDDFLFCPHHPHADDPAYRRQCSCRKPKPGMILKAAQRFHVDLAQSYMVGDRPSDVVAGQRAGCSSLLLRSGRHLDPAIVAEDFPKSVHPDHCCDTWPELLQWIGAHAKQKRAESGVSCSAR